MSCSNLNFCSGCLSSERKMQLLNKYWNKQCFVGILNEISMPQTGMNPVWLCWECEALLTRFTKFKHQVRHSYKMLHEYAKENLNLLESQKKSTLRTQKQFHITINSIETNCVSNLTLECQQSKKYIADETRVKSETDVSDYVVIGCEHKEKIENPTPELFTDKTNVKSEIDDTSLNSDEDSEFLIEISRKSNTPSVDENKELTFNDDKEVKSETKDVSDTKHCSRRKNKKNTKIKATKKKKRKAGNSEIYEEIELTREELEEERRVLLSSEDFMNAVFKCDKCIVSFPNREDLKDHIYGKHEQVTKHRCPVCECYLPTEASLSYHVGRHTTRFQCGPCGHRSGTRSAATRHYYTEHCHSTDIDQAVQEDLIENGDEAPPASEDISGAPAPHPCASCGQTFPSRAALREHAATHRGAGAGAGAGARYPCASCDKTFRWRTSLRKHAETHRIAAGDQRRPYCEVCRQSFTATYNLQKHLKASAKHQIQLKLRKLGEPQPGAAPDTQLQARIDVIKSAVMASRQLHACAQCGRRFQWRGNLLRHLQSHRARANGELVCAPCDRTFSSIATFNQHMRNSKRHVDESEFRYMCSECGKRFASKPRLRDHIDWDHLKNYVHSCATCQKVFKCHTSLYLHKQLVHSKDRANHLCDHCGKHFPSRSKLRCHMTAVHSGSAPYKCAQCDARFNWASCLSRHVKRLHKGKEAAAASAGSEKQ